MSTLVWRHRSHIKDVVSYNYELLLCTKKICSNTYIFIFSTFRCVKDLYNVAVMTWMTSDHAFLVLIKMNTAFVTAPQMCVCTRYFTFITSRIGQHHPFFFLLNYSDTTNRYSNFDRAIHVVRVRTCRNKNNALNIHKQWVCKSLFTSCTRWWDQHFMKCAPSCLCMSTHKRALVNLSWRKVWPFTIPPQLMHPATKSPATTTNSANVNDLNQQITSHTTIQVPWVGAKYITLIHYDRKTHTQRKYGQVQSEGWAHMDNMSCAVQILNINWVSTAAKKKRSSCQ